MNELTLEGNLVKDPKFIAGNTGLVLFTLAINYDGSNKVDYIPCKAFKELAQEIADNYTKGSKIKAIGKITSNSYKKDGVPIYSIDMLVNKIVK